MLIELLRTAARTPRGIDFGAVRVSYAELAERSIGFAAGLSRIGIAAGDKVAIVLPNGPELAISLVAITAIGAVAVPLNPLYESTELGFYTKAADVRAFVAGDATVRKCRGVLDALGVAGTIIADSTASGADHAFASVETTAAGLLPALAPDALSILLHSSGSTGRPKLVPRTNAQVRAEADNFGQTVELSQDDVLLCTVPLFHSYGLGYCLLAALRAGCEMLVPVALNPLPRYVGEVGALVAAHGVTVWPGTPFVFELIGKHAGRPDMSSIRLCISAGSALSREVFDGVLARHQLAIRQLYGCSEAGAVSVNLAHDVASFADSVGTPLANVGLEIEDADGSGVGEVVIRSTAMTDGYWNEPEINRSAFVAGAFRSGDLGRLDDDGRLWLTGRRRLFFEIGGNKVNPYEIEDVLASFPGVREAVVVGTHAEGEGEILKAVIVADAPINSRAIRRFCRERLAPFKVPSVVEQRDEIPKNPLGKVLRKHLM